LNTKHPFKPATCDEKQQEMKLSISGNEVSHNLQKHIIIQNERREGGEKMNK
jgi:hypothetical protein